VFTFCNEYCVNKEIRELVRGFKDNQKYIINITVISSYNLYVTVLRNTLINNKVYIDELCDLIITNIENYGLEYGIKKEYILTINVK
jgi:hypothetical protein